MRSIDPRRTRSLMLSVLAIAALAGFASRASAEAAAGARRPTVVLVHGAFAGSSSWSGVITPLLRQGYPVRAVALPLRGLDSDVRYVASTLRAIEGPVVLVGHSYGGAVISGAAKGLSNVKALVFVAGFAPERGESAATLSARSPGSTLAPTLVSVPLAAGGKDLYIRDEQYPAQFAADVPRELAAVMAATQRPVTESALGEPAGAPAWKEIPSWFLFGELDKNIPAAVHRFMASRAQAKQTVEIPGASHAVGVSHPAELTKMIVAAAASSDARASETPASGARQGRRPPPR